jgi:dihydropteroate synthase
MLVIMNWTLHSRRPIASTVPGAQVDGRGSAIQWRGCALMGVVNTTPDSFSDGGLYLGEEAALAHARRLQRDGAFVIDIGGESTRPGAVDVPEAVELERAIPVIERLAADRDVLISIDTRKPRVAAAAIDAGAHIVNDITGLRDPEMVAVCADAGVPAIVMHMRGTPADMQVSPRYDDVVSEVTEWLLARADAALRGGVPDVMIDPGLGFGKTTEHNVALLRALPLSARHPVLVGLSRKRTIQVLAGLGSDEPRDIGSIAAHLFAAHHGAAMVRVHDVAGHRQAFAVDAALRDDDQKMPS